MDGNNILNRLFATGFFSRFDIRFSEFISRISPNTSSEVSLAAALVARFSRQGHVCVDLKSLGDDLALPTENFKTASQVNHFIEALKLSAVVGKPGEFRPLVLDDTGRLYLHRYWDYQENLASSLKHRVDDAHAQEINHERLKHDLDQLFRTHYRQSSSANTPEATKFPQTSAQPNTETDWQKVAAYAAATQKLCIISGGPGTGKTTTVARILALLIAQCLPNIPRCGLAAPTGKAAARLQEAIRLAKTTLSCEQNVKALIPEQAITIHRLIGTIPGSARARFNSGHKLPLDLVVVDEASMVDLPLMSKLVQALPAAAKLILLGDKDQLGSIEPGAILGDICHGKLTNGFSQAFCQGFEAMTGEKINTYGPASLNILPDPGIHDCVVQLKKSFRFQSGGSIAALSQAINKGDCAQAIDIMCSGEQGSKWVSLPEPNNFNHVLVTRIKAWLADYLSSSTAQEAFCHFDKFRILCATHEGPYGTIAINRVLTRMANELANEQTVSSGSCPQWYHGRPVLITGNDYTLQLFNGDIGITLRALDNPHSLTVSFAETAGNIRRLHPQRLPAHETAYAMTVHKSQGSEFDHVLMILPDKDMPVLTRELIYTAVSRAKATIEVWAKYEIFCPAMTRRTKRMSGLAERLSQ